MTTTLPWSDLASCGLEYVSMTLTSTSPIRWLTIRVYNRSKHCQETIEPTKSRNLCMQITKEHVLNKTIPTVS